MADISPCINADGGAQSPVAPSVSGPLDPHFICETQLPNSVSPVWTATNWHSKPPITTKPVPKSLSSMNFNCLLSLYFVVHSHPISVFSVHAVD